MEPLQGKTIAFLIDDNFEQVEYTAVNEALEDAGALTEIVSPHEGPLQGLNGLDYGESFAVTRTLDMAKPKDYDALVVPGGVVNADNLRTNMQAQAFLRAFEDAGKPIAMICHAPWLAINAGVVEGVTITSWPSLKHDITNAGGEWADRDAVHDGVFITARGPENVEAFTDRIIEALSDEEV